MTKPSNQNNINAIESLKEQIKLLEACPTDRAWQRLEMKLNQKETSKSIRKIKYFSVASCIVMCLGFLFFSQINSEQIKTKLFVSNQSKMHLEKLVNIPEKNIYQLSYLNRLNNWYNLKQNPLFKR